MALRFIESKTSETQPATGPSVVSSGLNDSGLNDLAESNLEGWFCSAQPFLIDRIYGLGSNIGHGLFVGWVEHTSGFVGFRCTQPNLQFAGAITKCETQQRQILELCPKSFYFD